MGRLDLNGGSIEKNIEIRTNKLKIGMKGADPWWMKSLKTLLPKTPPELRHIPGNGNQILSIETHQNGKESAYAYAARLNLENLELKAEIAARVSTEQERNRLIKELERSNRELREFASVRPMIFRHPFEKCGLSQTCWRKITVPP